MSSLRARKAGFLPSASKQPCLWKSQPCFGVIHRTEFSQSGQTVSELWVNGLTLAQYGQQAVFDGTVGLTKGMDDHGVRFPERCQTPLVSKVLIGENIDDAVHQLETHPEGLPQDAMHRWWLHLLRKFSHQFPHRSKT